MMAARMPSFINFCGLINGGEYIDNLSSIGEVLPFGESAYSVKASKKLRIEKNS